MYIINGVWQSKENIGWQAVHGAWWAHLDTGGQTRHTGKYPSCQNNLGRNHCHLPLTALDPSPKPVNGLSLTAHNGGFQGRLRRGYGWWIGFLVSSLGSQTEFRLAERGSSAVISSARFVPCLQDICVKKRKKEREKRRGKKKTSWHLADERAAEQRLQSDGWLVDL